MDIEPKMVYSFDELPSGEQQGAKKQDSSAKMETNRPHFSIDWRQLSYYQRERSSFFGLARKKHSPGVDSFEQQQQQPPKCESPTSDFSGASERTATTTTSNKKRILNNLDGRFRSGQLNAILGPSGAGKTTFLSALFGNKQEAAYGQTKVTWYRDAQHQQPIESGSALTPKRPIRIAFLPQHDHLLHHLTVYETLMFASKIKNATRSDLKKQSDRRRFHQQNVRRVAKMLKLVDCLDTRCGKLSGGQYKRVSIGQELLSEPDVIILDEPTSGLDAMTCLTTIRTLKSIASKHPMSIVLTIHQPDIDVFNLFDQIYVIAQGGMAIYEGPPQGVVPTLAKAGLFMPSATYNPARFIVENAFIIGPDGSQSYDSDETVTSDESCVGSSAEDDDDDDEDDKLACRLDRRQMSPSAASDFIRRSVASLTEAITGATGGPGNEIDLSLVGSGKLRDSGRRPLLNIGVQTSDGRLITSKQLHAKLAKPSRDEIRRIERYNLLKRLNEIQRARYQPTADRDDTDTEHNSTLGRRDKIQTEVQIHLDANSTKSDYSSEARTNTNNSIRALSLPRVDGLDSELSDAGAGQNNTVEKKSFVSMRTLNRAESISSSDDSPNSLSTATANGLELTIEQPAAVPSGGVNNGAAKSHRLMIPSPLGANDGTKSPASELSESTNYSKAITSSSVSTTMKREKLTRHFDKRLSAKHNCSRQTDYPTWYHAFLLTHRTWLSIVRDPVFFGIQFCMHTTIPILLALIFGSSQEEGCPRVGNFDLVEFAYAPDSEDFIRTTIKSIRQSIGNIGVVFFEMFVLSFAINCITALVFPLDMYVLLKEYRNGWYSLRSYFFGRTLADLPVPVVLHSMAMTILYFMTGQPLSAARFGAIIGIVILASLVAQSVGLTIGALLMRSSQSAVLAAAGIVAPFFALSGFIVRIHTLPWVAQFFANGSYLYHLLNGFIILRYGFNRCPCQEEEFEANPAHEIPRNIRTMASIWVGTYSDEYLQQANPLVVQQAQLANKTQNIDPNIDLIDKLMHSFKTANSYGHQIDQCQDVIPYAMLDFNLRDNDIYWCTLSLAIMLVVSRFITFSAIYYKIRSFS